MTATLTKVTTAVSAEEMRAMLTQSEGKIHGQPHPLGVEIRDFRPLAMRIMEPISGRGIVRCFGTTHFIVTAKKAAALGLN